MTYDLANDNPNLASADSSLSGKRVNRFLHIAESADDVVQQNKMQRRMGQLTGTCFQRCVGMDAANALWSVTYECDQQHGTPYHARLRTFWTEMQRLNLVVGGAMTDPKGDRSKGPSDQEDLDLFTRVVERRADGIVIRGAKAHQTGCVNSHWLLVMPTMARTALPVTHDAANDQVMVDGATVSPSDLDGLAGEDGQEIAVFGIDRLLLEL